MEKTCPFKGSRFGLDEKERHVRGPFLGAPMIQAIASVLAATSNQAVPASV
jgi:hypothetical protein